MVDEGRIFCISASVDSTNESRTRTILKKGNSLNPSMIYLDFWPVRPDIYIALAQILNSYAEQFAIRSWYVLDVYWKQRSRCISNVRRRL